MKDSLATSRCWHQKVFRRQFQQEAFGVIVVPRNRCRHQIRRRLEYHSSKILFKNLAITSLSTLCKLSTLILLRLGLCRQTVILSSFERAKGNSAGRMRKQKGRKVRRKTKRKDTRNIGKEADPTKQNMPKERKARGPYLAYLSICPGFSCSST